MSDIEGSSPREQRVLAALEKALAARTQAFAQESWLASGRARSNGDAEAPVQDSAEGQRRAAEAQQRMARVYRGTVAGGLLLIGITVALVGWLLSKTL